MTDIAGAIPVAPIAPPITPPFESAPAYDENSAIAFLQGRGKRVYDESFDFDPKVESFDPLVKKIVGKLTSHHYHTEDQEILADTGIEKLNNEKTFDYRRRAFAQLKEQIKTNPDVEKVKGEYESKLTAKDKQIAEISLSNALAGLKLNVPEVAQESQRAMLLGSALSLPHRIENGNIVFQKFADDAKTLIDIFDPTTGKPVSPIKFLADHFKAFVTTEAPVPTGPNAKPKPAETNAAIPKNQKDLVALLQAEGVGRGGPDYMARLKAKAIEYAIKLDD